MRRSLAAGLALLAAGVCMFANEPRPSENEKRQEKIQELASKLSRRSAYPTQGEEQKFLHGHAAALLERLKSGAPDPYVFDRIARAADDLLEASEEIEESREADIPAQAQFLLRRTAVRLKLPVPVISLEALEWLKAQPWPGNVRELEHCLERALVLSRGGLLTTQHLEAAAPPAPADPFDAVRLEEGFYAAVARLERRLIERALAQAEGNRSRAAELLKINRRLLYDKMRQYKLQES